MDGFLQRLKQRKLVQWAIAYVAFAFALIQVLDVVTDSYGWPHTVMHIVFGLLVLGFVIALVLAWYHGERGAQRISGPELLLIALVLAVGGGLLWHFARGGSTDTARSLDSAQRNPGNAIPTSAAAATKSPDTAAEAAGSGLHTVLAGANNASTETTAFNPSADSIVVLPFANLGGEKSQQYFSDGITEELTSALGQNTGLTVIAWETASRYASGKQTPQEIGKALNVAHILNGSIQREGNEVRVSAELVSAVTGRQLWSAHYDATFKNIFAVQDKITGSIAGSLKVKFADMQAAPTLNPKAHELYLKGLALLDHYTAVDAQRAQNYFQEALKLDPDYADAWAGLAGTYGQLTEISTLPLQEAVSKMRAAAQKTLTLDPRNVSALVRLGNADAFDNLDAQAAQAFRQAINLDPSNARAYLAYGNVVPPEQALAEYRKAGKLDPDSAIVPLNLAVSYQDLGDWPQMVSAAQAILPRSPHNTAAAFLLAYAYTQLQRGEDAVKAFDRVQTTTVFDKQLMDAGRLAYSARLNPALRAEALAALDVLRHDDLSPTSQFELLQLYLALNEKQTALEILTPLCATAPYGCNDLAINSMYGPLRGDPRFEKLSKQYTTVALDSASASASSR